MSIPKLFILSKGDSSIINSWGPRPKPAHEIMLKWKNSGGHITKEDFERELHTWYAKDKGLTTIKELTAAMVSKSNPVKTEAA